MVTKVLQVKQSLNTLRSQTGVWERGLGSGFASLRIINVKSE